MKTAIAILITSVIAAALIVPAAAFATASHAPGASEWITGAKVPVSAWHTTGWAYSCPAAYPYLQLQGGNGPNNPGSVVYNNLSDAGVQPALSPLTDSFTGKLDVMYTNFNFNSANGQVSYECTTQAPSQAL